MRRIVLFLLILAVWSVATAAPLDNEVRNMTSEGGAGRALWGVYARELKSGSVLVDVNGSRLFLPASNRKLVSTAMAASLFEPTKTWKTRLSCDRLGADGTVAGDLILLPTGDPSWMPELQGGRPGQSKLTELARAAAAAGVRQVAGDLVIASGRYESPSILPPGWACENLADSYSGQPAVLSLNANLAGITIATGSVGEPLRIGNSSGVEPFEIINATRTLTGGSAPTFVINRHLEGRTLTLTGGLPSGTAPATRAVPLGDPAAYNAQLFVKALEAEGIRVAGKIRFESNTNEGSTLLAEVEGASLDKIITECNQASDNFLAESIYLLCSLERFGRASYQGASRAEEDFWKRIKVDPREVNSSDGCGLSRENYISPHALVELLAAMQGTEWFVESLPVSGRSGTLRYRLSDNGMAGRVKAKTGTLDGVTALSGYVTTSGGRVVAFSIMANNHTSSSSNIRSTIDDIVTRLAAR